MSAMPAVSTEPSLKGVGEPQARDILEQYGRSLSQARMFEAIDRQYRAHASQSRRTSSGLWASDLFLDGVVDGLAQPRPQSEEEWEKREAVA